MLTTYDTPPPAPLQDTFRWTRTQIVNHCDDFANANTTQRQYAQQHNIPHATFNSWIRQRNADTPNDPIDTFFASPPGELVLRRLLCATMLVFQEQGACGIRLVSQFLQLTQLDRYIAPSRGALHPWLVHLETNLLAFRDESQPTLAQQMTPRTITVITDENFHGPENCLVASEALSNFLLVEEYQPHRDAGTWTKALQKGVANLPVTILQMTSDQARGLICCAEKGLQVTHSPDLFHGQRDLLQPLMGPLTRPIQQAEKELDKAQQKTEKLCADEDASLTKKHLNQVIDAVRVEALLAEQLALVQEQKEAVVAEVRGLGDDYHPFDRQTGQPLTASKVGERLHNHLDRLEEMVTARNLPEKAHEALSKSRRWVDLLMGCVAWFWSVVRPQIEALDLTEEQEQAVYDRLLPGYYWEAASGRARTSSERVRLQELSVRLQSESWQESSVLALLDTSKREEVKRVARSVVGLFQRSSSCVEGRNGRLSLHHHGHSGLGERRLQALTVIHNYVVQRPDGTTAAERFFGKKPPDVFSWLLAKMPELPRPAKKRQKTNE